MKNQKPLVIAHRGAAGEAPENTLASFELALKQGCDAIELDVHLSKDGEIIVIHDATVNRTTDGKGKVNDMTVAELKQFDAGAWFGENGQYKGEKLPLLEEVFDLVPSNIIINVEVKGSYDRQLEPKLIELMKRKNRMESVVISSFDHKSLKYLKEQEPQVKIGLLYNENVMHHRKMAESGGVPVYSLHPNYKKIDAQDIADAIQHGLQVYAWTINDENALRQNIDLGVSGIITDYPGRLRSLLA